MGHTSRVDSTHLFELFDLPVLHVQLLRQLCVAVIYQLQQLQHSWGQPRNKLLNKSWCTMPIHVGWLQQRKVVGFS